MLHVSVGNAFHCHHVMMYSLLIPVCLIFVSSIVPCYTLQCVLIVCDSVHKHSLCYLIIHFLSPVHQLLFQTSTSLFSSGGIPACSLYVLLFRLLCVCKWLANEIFLND